MIPNGMTFIVKLRAIAYFRPGRFSYSEFMNLPLCSIDFLTNIKLSIEPPS